MPDAPPVRVEAPHRIDEGPSLADVDQRLRKPRIEEDLPQRFAPEEERLACGCLARQARLRFEPAFEASSGRPIRGRQRLAVPEVPRVLFAFVVEGRAGEDERALLEAER